MTTLRAATMGGGVRRKTQQTRQLRQLLGATLRGGFLLPKGYRGCQHEWVGLDSGYAVCTGCGDEHWCCCGGCPEEEGTCHERVCTITGCVTLEYVLRPERDASERVRAPFLLSLATPLGERERESERERTRARALMMAAVDADGSDDGGRQRRRFRPPHRHPLLLLPHGCVHLRLLLPDGAE
jgi:hypothetical protein